MARRPEWKLEPRPDEAVPPTLEAFLAAVACGAADTIQDQSATDGFLAGTSLPQSNKRKRESEGKKVREAPMC